MPEITDREVRELLNEAVCEEDWGFVVDCAKALMGDRDSRLHCAKVLKVYGIKENH